MNTKARSITVGSHTPWGWADRVKFYVNGAAWVRTPSHGGIYLPPHLNAKIPAAWRAASFNQQGENGWYEEDCDWCMVALTFPELMGPQAIESARKTFDYWIAKKLPSAPAIDDRHLLDGVEEGRA